MENESNDDASILIRNFGTNFWFKFMELQKRMFFVMKRIGTSGDGQELGWERCLLFGFKLQYLAKKPLHLLKHEMLTNINPLYYTIYLL